MKLQKFFICLWFLVFSCAGIAAHPIIFILTHNGADADYLEKVFRQEGSTRVFHSPFLNPYLQNQLGPQFVSRVPSKELDPLHIAQKIQEAAELNTVIIKENAYVLNSFLSQFEFLSYDNVKFIFYFRETAKSIENFYYVYPDNQAFEQSLGLHQLNKFYENQLELYASREMLLIQADEFLARPNDYLPRLNEFCATEITQEHFSWQPNTTPVDWYLVQFLEAAKVSSGLPMPRLNVETYEFSDFPKLPGRNLGEVYARQDKYFANLNNNAFRPHQSQ